MKKTCNNCIYSFDYPEDKSFVICTSITREYKSERILKLELRYGKCKYHKPKVKDVV